MLMIVALITTILAGCGPSTPSTTQRPLSSEEAASLADALYLDQQDGGATFSASAAWTSVGRTISMQGDVDWVNHQGHALVRATGADAGLTEVWWNTDVVIEYWPTLDAVLGGLGHPEAHAVSREPDPDKRLVDHVIAVVNGLAAPERENPLLIQQKPGSAFVRNDELRGSPVDILRYGERNLYWLSQDTSRLLRFDGNAATGAAPTVVDLLSTGPRTITPPPLSAVIPASTLGSVYTSLTGS